MKNKLLRVVKMTAYYSFLGFILQVFFVNVLLAGSVEGQNLKNISVSINVTNITLEQAFRVIEQKTNFTFGYVREDIPLDSKVTLKLESESLQTILEGLARDYSLVFNRINDHIVVRKAAGQTEQLVIAVETSSIKGRVTDVKTGEALIGANLMLKGTSIGVASDNRGYYALENINTGNYTIVVKYVGYATKSENINIVSNRTLELNFSLQPSLVDLDEVVVSGAYGQTEKRAMSNPVTVISTKTLESLPASTFYDLFTKKVPGFFMAEQGEGYNNSFSHGFRGAGFIGYKQVNYYVDGILIENYINNDNMITNLNNIEKIEILRGPMATTLYGSRKSTGVVNITTKSGKLGNLKIGLNSFIAIKENKYAESAKTKNQQSLNISGGSGQFGYNLALTHFDDYFFYDAIIPKNTTWQSNVSVNASVDQFSVRTALSYISSDLAFQSYGYNILLGKERGWDKPVPITKIDWVTFYRSFNASVDVKQILSANWYHNLTLGYTYYEWKSKDIGPTGWTGGIWVVNTSSTPKLTARYIMNNNLQLADNLSADLTAGIDYWYRIDQSFGYYDSRPATYEFSSKSFTNNYMTYRTETNEGYFGQTIFGYDNKLFLTLGLRFERNSGFADKKSLQSLPRIGLSYVQELGNITIKPRASWGKNINPPREEQVTGRPVTSTGAIFDPNYDLVPETSSGYEVGVDFYYGDLLSLEATYYNQKTNNLFNYQVTVDTNNRTHLKYINVAEVFANGFEVAGLLNLNPFTVNLTFTATNNRYGKDAEKLKKKEGSRLASVPVTSAYVDVNYKFPSLFSSTGKGGSVSINVSYQGTMIDNDMLGYWDYKYKTGAPKVAYGTLYDTKSLTLFGLAADYWVTDDLNVYLDAKNLFGAQRFIFGYLGRGRYTTLGVKYSL